MGQIITIMRAFVKLRHILLDHAELKRELDELRSQTEEKFQVVFPVLDKLVNEGEEEKRRGNHRGVPGYLYPEKQISKPGCA